MQYIDPRNRPFGEDSENIWEWMKAVLQNSKATDINSVPGTELNQIEESMVVTLVSPKLTSCQDFVKLNFAAVLEEKVHGCS